jgi:L-asparaginase
VSRRPRIGVFSLGGTIAAMASRDGPGAAPELSAADLLAGVSGLDQVAEVTATSVQTLPGIELTFRHVVDLAETIDRALAGGLDGAVVTQGTDTLEETSFLLDLLVGDKPVVTTAAMRQADAVGADGPANLLAAVQVAASGLTRGAGVVIVMGDEVHAAAFCRKAHTSRPAGFVSDLGPIGWVTEGEPRILLAPRERFRLHERPSGDARVALVGTPRAAATCHTASPSRSADWRRRCRWRSPRARARASP